MSSRSPRLVLLTLGGNPTVDEVVDGGATWRRIRKVGIPLLFGLLCVVITRWPIAGVLGALALATLPASLRKVPPGEASKKTEAVATWTESIRDSLAASAGLSQAIVVTAPSAPTPNSTPVNALAKRLNNGVPLEDALRSFAHEVEDAAAEFLVCRVAPCRDFAGTEVGRGLERLGRVDP